MTTKITVYVETWPTHNATKTKKHPHCVLLKPIFATSTFDFITKLPASPFSMNKADMDVNEAS